MNVAPPGRTVPVEWGAKWLGEGTSFALWAPSAAEVVVLGVDGPGHKMDPQRDGWHAAILPDFPPGARYKFLVNGAAVPDPASRSQPDGPEGFSEVTDPGAYRWSDSAWHGRPWNETVLYELHVGTFSRDGRFAGVIPHLDHLATLGVTMIELMPVGSFPGGWGWGYDGVLPFAPNAVYGSPDDLRRLVEACHAHGISVMLDVVYNHFGPHGNMLPSYLPEFFTDKHTTPWGEAIAFDGPGAQAVREFYIQNALYWISDFHLDGLRLDAVQAVKDDSPEHILAEIARRVRAADPGRTVHLVLENDNNEARWLVSGRYEAQWNDDFHHALRVLTTGRRDGYYSDYADDPLQRLGCALTEGFSYQGEESRHRPGLLRGTPSAHLPPTAFVNFIQNHDQVGNTPFGRRITELASEAQVRLATAVTLLSPGIPMLFMGQEWGSARPFDFFCDFPQPLAGLVRDGRRSEFSHLPEFQDADMLAMLADPTAATTRDGSVLDWEAVGQEPHAGWLAFHRHLLAMRRQMVVPLLPDISGSAGSFKTIPAEGGEDGQGVIEARWALRDGGRLVLAANFCDVAAVWAGNTPSDLFRLVGDAQPGMLAPWDLVLTREAAAMGTPGRAGQ
jgi:maltooligosyltrehalose trehalohydrolase